MGDGKGKSKRWRRKRRRMRRRRMRRRRMRRRRMFKILYMDTQSQIPVFSLTGYSIKIGMRRRWRTGIHV